MAILSIISDKCRRRHAWEISTDKPACVEKLLGHELQADFGPVIFSNPDNDWSKVNFSALIRIFGLSLSQNAVSEPRNEELKGSRIAGLPGAYPVFTELVGIPCEKAIEDAVRGR